MCGVALTSAGVFYDGDVSTCVCGAQGGSEYAAVGCQAGEHHIVSDGNPVGQCCPPFGERRKVYRAVGLNLGKLDVPYWIGGI